jgi:hypothetical protein
MPVGRSGRRLSGGGGRQPRRRTAMVVERREAQRAPKQAVRASGSSVARATPEAWAGGNIRPRGVAHDPGASRGSTRAWLFVRMAFVNLAFRDSGFRKTRTHGRRENARACPARAARRLLSRGSVAGTGRRPARTRLYLRNGHDSQRMYYGPRLERLRRQ